MNPSEPRFVRYLAQAKETEGNTPGAIAAWKVYLRLVADDQVAQIELIDLYLSQQQSNEGKIATFGNCWPIRSWMSTLRPMSP